jgi:hypothetical protein
MSGGNTVSNIYIKSFNMQFIISLTSIRHFILTPWCRKLRVAHVVRKFLICNAKVHYHGHEPITGIYPEPLESSSLCYILFLKVHFNTTIIMFLDIIHRLVFCLKSRPVYISKHNISETGFYLCPRVKPTLLGPIDRASPHLWMMDNVQEHNNCTNLPSSQTFRSYPL